MKCSGALPAPPVESATALGRGWSRGQGQLQAAERDGKDEVDDAEERRGIGGGYPIFTEAGGSDTRPLWELVYLATTRTPCMQLDQRLSLQVPECRPTERSAHDHGWLFE